VRRAAASALGWSDRAGHRFADVDSVIKNYMPRIMTDDDLFDVSRQHDDEFTTLDGIAYAQLVFDASGTASQANRTVVVVDARKRIKGAQDGHVIRYGRLYSLVPASNFYAIRLMDDLPVPVPTHGRIEVRPVHRTRSPSGGGWMKILAISATIAPASRRGECWILRRGSPRCWP
jgi:hypothetical protein